LIGGHLSFIPYLENIISPRPPPSICSIYLHISPWLYGDDISIFKFTYTFYGTAMDISIHSVVIGCVPECYCIVILMNPIKTMICFASDRGRNVIESCVIASEFSRCLHSRNVYSICRPALCEWNY
jgi:hypothetical protein